MADRPAVKNEAAKRETAKKDEAYQPLWDTDQSIPEYMALLMDQQSSTEDAELYEESDDEELEHPDPDYEYVYPGAPKRYDSARKNLEDLEDLEDEDAEHEEGEPEDSHDTDNIDEPEDTSEDTHESRKDEEANHPVALASVEQAQQEQAQAMQTQATHAYGKYVRLEQLGLQPSAILPVIPEPFFGIPDSELIEMRLLDRSLESSAPMQACAVHLNPVKIEENPVSRAAKQQPVGYVPINNPLAGSNIEEIESQRTFWKTVLIVLLILNPFVLVPLVSMFDNSAGMSMLFFFIIIGLGSFFVVPILWIVGIVQAVKHKNRLRELIQKTKTTHAEFWYYLVYNRLPDDYMGINGYTKKHGFFDEYEALKKQERAKLRESAAQREPAALHKPAAHPKHEPEEPTDQKKQG